MSNQKAAVLEQLINKGRFREARRQAATLALNKEEKSARFYFTAALAEMLDPHGSAIWAAEYTAAARDAKGYTPLMEVDLLRDQALLALKQGETNQARVLARRSLDLLHQIEEETDPVEWANRAAIHHMVEGRILLADGQTHEAQNEHRTADRQFRELGDAANKQWELNNGLHWLRAAAGENVDYRFAQFGWVIDGDPNRLRRWRSRLLMYCGRTAYRWDDRIVRRLFG